MTGDGILKNWSFELYSDVTSLAITQAENTYALTLHRIHRL